METRFLTYPRAAEFLKSLGVPLTENTLRQYVSRGILAHVKIGSRVLFDREELTDWIESRHVSARAARVEAF